MKSSTKIQWIGLLFIVGITFALTSISLTLGQEDEDDDDDDDDDEDDWIKTFGLVGIVLLSLSLLKMIPILGMKIEKLFLKKNPESNYKRYFHQLGKKTLKPLRKLHYYLVILSFPFILIHGISLFEDLKWERITGPLTFALHTLLIISGVIMWRRWPLFKDPERKKKFRKILYRVHTSLIPLILVFIIHFLHIVSED